MNKTTILIGMSIVVIIGMGFLFREKISSILFRQTVGDPHARLINENQFYLQADALRESGGDPDRVIELYKQALAIATNPAERGQIEFKIASEGVRVHTEASIEQLKVLIADPAQSDIQKAYAVQQLGQTYYKNTNKETVSGIFSGEPYSDFFREGDVRLALRRLFEYAASFYPLAISELRATRWYANEVYTLRRKESLTEDEQIRVETYLNIIRERLALAEADIERTRNAPNAKSLIPEAFIHRAGILGRLSLAGEESFGDPNSTFQEAININIPIRGDGPPRIAYAGYLVDKYGGEARKDDIIAILNPLISDISSYGEGVKIYIGSERDNILGQKNRFIYFASLVPGFEEMLISLGWSEADFVS